MRRFTRMTVSRSTAVIIAVTLCSAMMLAACSVDYNGLSDGLGDLSDSLSGIAGTTTESAEATDATEQTEQTTAEATPTPEPSPTPTATPTPSPTPIPERVDFSELTSETVTADFTAELEEFEESTNTDDNELLVSFSGTRMLVTDNSAANVQDAVNLILDGYYEECAGIYSRMGSDAKAQVLLTGVPENPASVEVGFSYSDNGRVLSVVMTRTITDLDGNITSSSEYANFDMLNGQYVTLASVASDPAGLEEALKAKLAADINVSPEPQDNTAVVSDTDDTGTTETTATQIKNDRKNIAPADVTDISIAAQEPGAQTSTVTIYGTVNGTTYHTTTDFNDYSQYLNRYGKQIFLMAN